VTEAKALLLVLAISMLLTLGTLGALIALGANDGVLVLDFAALLGLGSYAISSVVMHYGSSDDRTPE